ncbi:hypothetical protein Q1695_001981 [Nippostrongylus brasiliensis]|nr:hypothetical protein Q1695_001981 [Nippostrongylus brasiliensis]
MNKLLLLCSIASLEVESRSNCYSCASSNMKANFLTSPRGPSGRKKEPLTYDNHCDDDPWIIKQRSTESCETKCFKWQQLLNNSGSFSKMTFRGCYDTMFDIRNPSTHAIPDHNFCTAGEVQLTCLADASIIEHSCWCEGDYCNASQASDIYPQDGRRSVENLSQSGLSDEDIEVERDQLKSTQSAGEVLCEKLKASKQIKRISIMRPQMWSQCVKNLTSKTRKTKEKKKNEEGKTEAKSKVEAVLNKGVKVSESLKAKEAKEVETAKASVSLKVKEPENVESTEEIKKGTKVEAFFDGGGAQVAISLLASLDGQKLQVVAK